MTATIDHHVTIREAAERLAVSTKTIRRRIAAGELSAVRVGSGQAVRVPVAAIDDLLRPVTHHLPA